MPEQSNEAVLYDEVGDIGILTINRPNVLNAIDELTLLDMQVLLYTISKGHQLKGLILTGAGERAFVAGADIAEMMPMSAAESLKLSKLGQEVTLALEQAPFFTLAAVNGFALGGGFELALACDFIFASDHAKFGLPEVSLGVIPGFGGTQRLTKAVGPRKAKELILSAKTINAQEAQQLGLVNQICQAEHLINDSKEFLEKVLSHPMQALKSAKTAIDAAQNLTIEQGLELERNLFGVCFTTPDRQERMSAFLNKAKKS